MLTIKRYIPIKPFLYAICSLTIIAITVGLHTALAFSEKNEAEELRIRTDISRISILKNIEKSIIENNSIVYNYYHTKW